MQYDVSLVGGGGLVHHPDRVAQYLTIPYPERLAEAGNASAMTIISHSSYNEEGGYSVAQQRLPL